jgi:hypothetical protein
LTAFTAHAVTLDEVAGIYVGKMTATNSSGVTRFDQVTVIEPDGHVTFYLYAKGDTQPQVVIGFINPLYEDGTFPVPNGSGQITLKGRHLTLTLNLPGLTTDFQGHRTDTALVLPH